MAFWDKKDESEWDKYQRLQQEADRERQEPREEEPAIPLAERLAEKLRPAKEEAPPESPAERCPWCGGEMRRGFLQGDRGVYWTDHLPGLKERFLGFGRGDFSKVDNEGGVIGSFQTAWDCPSCRKMVLDTSAMPSPLGPVQKEGPLFTGGEGDSKTQEEI